MDYIGKGNIAFAFFIVQKKEETIMTEKGITCEIVRPIAVLSENERGYTKEVNRVSWSGADRSMTSGIGIRAKKDAVRG